MATKTAPTNNCVSASPCYTPDGVRDQVNELLGISLEAAFPVDFNIGKPDPNSKYSPMVHAQLCRMRFLGLNDRECGESVGITANTLKKWLGRYPRLAVEMAQAQKLSMTRAAIRLQQLMLDPNGTVSLNAVKFYLSSQSESFRERQELTIKPDLSEAVRQIKDMYGLKQDEPFEPTHHPEMVADTVVRLEELPILPAEAAADRGASVSDYDDPLDEILAGRNVGGNDG